MAPTHAPTDSMIRRPDAGSAPAKVSVCMPAENARSPTPVRTTARLAWATAARIASRSASVSALSTSGRSSVIVRIPSSSLMRGRPMDGLLTRWRPARSVRSASPGLFLLGQVLLDDVELALPQRALALHPRLRLGERAGGQAQAVRPPVDDAHDRARVLEHAQVPADRGLGDAEVAGRLAHGHLATGEALDDLAADGVRAGGER